MVLLYLLLALVCYSQCSIAVSRDPETVTATVLRTLVQLQRAVRLTANEVDILRRIAYVEALADRHNGSNGGIWAVDRSLFYRTQSFDVSSRVRSKRMKLEERLGILWEEVPWSDMADPLHSATAALLVILLAQTPPPPSGDLIGQALFWRAHYNTAGLLEDFIRAQDQLEGSHFKSSGQEFYIGFPRNIIGASQALIVTTRSREPVEFTVQTITGIHFIGTARRNASTLVNLGSSFQVANSSDRSGGIKITSSRTSGKLEVNGLNYQRYTSDTFLALPCTRLQTEEYKYFAVSYGDISGPNQILLVACEDNTTITFENSKVLLNETQTFLIEDEKEITGREFVSDKPISFFSGHLCTYVPHNVLACDHIIEQLPLTAVWGTRFFLASLFGRRSPDIYRIVTSSPKNRVDVLCASPTKFERYRYQFYMHEAGDWEELELPAGYFCSVDGESPLLVVQFGLAHRIDYVGDPFMMTIPSLTQYGNFFTVRALSEFSYSFVTILVQVEFFQPNKVFVDETNLEDAVWNPIYCPNERVCGYSTYVQLGDGDHTVYHSNAVSFIGVLVYGFDAFNSYGHAAGLQFIPSNRAAISFARCEYTVSESSGIIQVSVLRSRRTQEQSVVLVQSGALESSATEGQDYSQVIELVVFEPGEVEKSVEIVITDDREVEKERETIYLYLTGGDDAVLTPFPNTVVAITDDDGDITLSPPHGSQLGGSAHLVTLSSTPALLHPMDNITCLFAGHPVKAVFVNSSVALCVSPELRLTGAVDFTITIERSHPPTLRSVLRATSGYMSIPFQNGFGVATETTDGGPVLERGSVVTVRWLPTLFVPFFLNSTTATVDITLRLLDTHTNLFSISVPIESELANSVTASVTIPATLLSNRSKHELPLLPMVIQVGANLPSLDSVLGNCSQLSNDCKGLVVGKHSSVRLLDLSGSEFERSRKCREWAENQVPGIGQRLKRSLPPCPCTKKRAALPNSGFKRDTFSSYSIPPLPNSPHSLKYGERARDGQRLQLVDDSYQQLFHKNASVCYRQSNTFLSSNRPSGQQCCYNDRGYLIVGPASGGAPDLVSPDVDFLQHLRGDVVPQWMCCEAGPYSQCGSYYHHRPSDDCSASLPPTLPGLVFGDSHLVTLDGLSYTFNGRGEFILITADDGSFTLQGRMTEIAAQEEESSFQSESSAKGATGLTAVVASEPGADTVQFEVIGGDLQLRVNGRVHQVLSDEMQFRNVAISSRAPNTLAATFTTGARIEVRSTNSLLSLLAVSLPERYAQKRSTKGLLGPYNKDSSDDFLPRYSDVPLQQNSSLEDIHWKFGITWMVGSPEESIFTYDTGKSWATYYDPYITPNYNYTYSNSTAAEERAVEVCEGDRECLFYAALTGRVDIAAATNDQANLEILELMVPIVCDCENGACVSNNTCYCGEGFSGQRCTQRVLSACERDLCENGGTCYRHVRDHFCSCPKGYGGTFCQDGDDEERPMIGSLIVLIAGIIPITVVVSVITTVIFCRYRHLF